MQYNYQNRSNEVLHKYIVKLWQTLYYWILHRNIIWVESYLSGTITEHDMSNALYFEILIDILCLIHKK